MSIYNKFKKSSELSDAVDGFANVGLACFVALITAIDSVRIFVVRTEANFKFRVEIDLLEW